MRGSCLADESERLAGEPGSPVQFREENHQRKQEDLRQDKIPAEIGKDRPLIEHGLMRHFRRDDHPKTIGYKPSDKGCRSHRWQGQGRQSIGDKQRVRGKGTTCVDENAPEGHRALCPETIFHKINILFGAPAQPALPDNDKRQLREDKSTGGSRYGRNERGKPRIRIWVGQSNRRQHHPRRWCECGQAIEHKDDRKERQGIHRA